MNKKQKKKNKIHVQYVYQSQINVDGNESMWGEEPKYVETYLLHLETVKLTLVGM